MKTNGACDSKRWQPLKAERDDLPVMPSLFDVPPNEDERKAGIVRALAAFYERQAEPRNQWRTRRGQQGRG